MDVEFLRYKFEDGFIGVLTKTRFKIGIRHLQMLYMFACSVVLGVLRGSIGVTLLSINDPTRQHLDYEVYNWSQKIQGSILSSFFWGYALTVLPAELLLRRLGGKFVVAGILLVNGSLTAALPTIVEKGGWIAVCNTQFIMGMSQACLSPANQSLLHKWMPGYERTIASFIIHAGLPIGVIIAYPICGRLAVSRLGWELIYYTLAIMALSGTIIWTLLTASSPDDHPAVADVEKEFISEALHCYQKKQLQIPWSQILRSPAFWAITSAHISANAVFVFYLVEVPAYLSLGLGLTLTQAASYSSIPFVFLLITYLAAAPTLDWFYQIGVISYMMSITQYRKIINGLGAIGTILGLSLLTYVGPDSSYLAILLLTVIFSFVGLQYLGFLETHRDMSENFSGTLFTMGSVPANIGGALVPFISGLVLSTDATDLRHWRVIFCLLASLIVVCNGLYSTLGTAERQAWDHCDKRTKFGHYQNVNQLEMEDVNGKATHG